MENELVVDIEKIVVKQGSIQFNDYENVKQQAIKLAEEIKTVEVTEDNIKQSKKLLAAVNKRLKELDDKRISIKKVMLEPYQLFEEQVKEIAAIVKDADQDVREQVKYLEEFERLEKSDEIEEIFEKRKQHYSFRDLVHFYQFLKPQHLNKSTSIAAVEKEIIEFLENIEADIKATFNMVHGDEILSAYFKSFNLGLAITQVSKEIAHREQIQASEVIKKQPTEDKIAFLVTVQIYSQKELKLLEMILQENDFEFITDKVVL
jgi:hypothetical protein